MEQIIKNLSENTGLLPILIKRIISDAPYRYKRYYIRKRNGSKRLISQPAKEVKLIQRSFSELYLKHLPVHDRACAYIYNKSILDNAKEHIDNNCILKMDFKDFFLSIKKSDWINYCKDKNLFQTDDEVQISANILFHRTATHYGLRLAVGAPTSPILSNILMFKFDEIINQICLDEKVIYTRYADDLTFSAARAWNLFSIQQKINKVLKTIEYPKLELNLDKTHLVTKKYGRYVTGLTLANERKVTVGKKRKREVRAAIHAAKSNKLNQKELQKLSGILAFVNSIEPNFIESMAEKYGAGTIEYIKKHASLKRSQTNTI